jgi:hypothetical protein
MVCRAAKAPAIATVRSRLAADRLASPPSRTVRSPTCPWLPGRRLPARRYPRLRPAHSRQCPSATPAGIRGICLVSRQTPRSAPARPRGRPSPRPTDPPTGPPPVSPIAPSRPTGSAGPRPSAVGPAWSARASPPGVPRPGGGGVPGPVARSPLAGRVPSADAALCCRQNVLCLVSLGFRLVGPLQPPFSAPQPAPVQPPILHARLPSPSFGRLRQVQLVKLQQH